MPEPATANHLATNEVGALVLTSTHHRGHPITLTGDTWVYSDTGEPVPDNPTRRCGHCQRPNRDDGHDACLGVLPGVRNACCGHGDLPAAYVQTESGALAGALRDLGWARALRLPQVVAWLGRVLKR